MYGRNAEEVKSALLAACPRLTVVLNPEKPRKKSFEITLLDGGKGEKVEIQKYLNHLASPKEDHHSELNVATSVLDIFEPFESTIKHYRN